MLSMSYSRQPTSFKLFSALTLSTLLVFTSHAAIPWSKVFVPALTTMQDPTIKTLHSADFSQGFIFTGVSDIRGFNTFQTTATGARFNPTGQLQWGAFLDAGSGSRHQRVTPLADMNHFFVGYTANGKGHVAVYHGGTMAKRFGHEFELRAISEDMMHLRMDLHAGNVIAVAQYLSEDAVHVLLLDEHGNTLSDRDYAWNPPLFGDPSVMLLRLPDQTGFMLFSRGHLICLNNDGTVRWAKSGVNASAFNDIPPQILPDGSLVITTDVPPNPGFPAGGTAMRKFNPDGTFAWARSISRLQPVSHIFLLGRNPVFAGGSLWLVGGAASESNPSGGLDGAFLGLVRIDSGTGEILAQADLSFEDRDILRGEFGAWTGQNAFFMVETSEPAPPPLTRGYLLRLDGNLENPELLVLSGGLHEQTIETTRVSYDAATDNLLYTATSGNGRVIYAISLDANTMIPGRCDLFDPAPFQLAPATWESIANPGSPTISDVAITVQDAGTPLAPTDPPVLAMVFNEFDLCPGDPSPNRPVLRLQQVPAGQMLNLTFPSETGVTYDILFTPSLNEGFELIETLAGTGEELVFAAGTGSAGEGYYLVRAVPAAP